WLHDLRADQLPDGNVTFVTPDVLTELNARRPDPLRSAGAAAWGDAAVICPWTVYQCYGDRRLLEEQYESMVGWVEFIRGRSDDDHIWRRDFQFGDWLDFRGTDDRWPTPVTNHELIATAFYAYSTQLLANAADVLGKSGDARHYAELANNIKAAFNSEFVTPAGRVGPNTQTAYVLALQFDLLPEQLRPLAAKRLAEEIRLGDYHVTTGFVGTPYVCHVLSRFGYADVAYRLLTQEGYPSWLYPVKQGATTIWERWDGIKPDGSFRNASMNSFNHYAYGAIGD
ncbi:MAG: alpha-L-rhamnosidase, partial [Anaerolineae bacterium]|nr:alpha-L-rhamnosidase [Anaerolineae bacterium]